MTVERPPAPPRPVRPSAPAWWAIGLSPFFCVVAIWMSFFVLGDEDIQWWGSAIMMLMVFVPPVAAVVLGVLAARSGNRRGLHAAATAAAWMAALLMFWYAANYPYNGESNAMPLVLGLLTGAVVAAIVEGLSLLRPR